MSSSSYRDDLEAALSRVAALEAEVEHSEEQARELEQLRDEVARLSAELEERKEHDDEARAGRERERERTDDTSAKSDRRVSRFFVGLGLLLALFFVGTCEYYPLKAWYRAHHGRGAVFYTSLVDPAAGTVAVVTKIKVIGVRSCDKYVYWRIDLIDAEHGRHIARLVPDKQKLLEPPRVARAGPGRMWTLMQHHGRPKRLQLRSTRDLSIVTSWSDLQHRNSALDSDIYGHVLVDRDGAAIVTTRGGDVLRIDGTTGIARALATKRGAWMRSKQHGSWRKTRLDGLDYKFVRGDDSLKRCLTNGQPPLSNTVRGYCGRAAKMLDPVFISAMDQQPLLTGSERDFIIAHGESIGARSGYFLVSRLSRSTRTLLWTKRVPKGHLTAQSTAHGKALVIFVCQNNHTQSYAIALDKETGAELWRLAL